MFRDQITTVSNWFDRWSSCEQTVGMVALLRRLSPTQQRFLTSVLQRQLSDCPELRRSEILANDHNYISTHLLQQQQQEASRLLPLLLQYLPLLNPKNHEVKSLYLSLIPQVLQWTLEQGQPGQNSQQLEEARQLLSYSLIHPGFTVEDRGIFTPWLGQFEEKLQNSQNQQAQQQQQQQQQNEQQQQQLKISTSNSPPTPARSAHSSGGSPGNSSSPNSGSYFHRIRRSNSLTPPVLHSDSWSSQDLLPSYPHKPRSLSISSELCPSGSSSHHGHGHHHHHRHHGGHQSEPCCGNGSGNGTGGGIMIGFNEPGMRDVPGWLKSLRLHKYSLLFSSLTYEQMLGLTEAQLEAQGVTKGARTKIILSIGKLKERIGHLRRGLESLKSGRQGSGSHDLNESIRNALIEIKWTLGTPIKPALDEPQQQQAPIGTQKSQNTGSTITPNEEPTIQDLILGTLTQTMDLWTESMSSLGPGTSPCPFEGLLIGVLEKCLAHDGFSVGQKRVLSGWRAEIGMISGHLGQVGQRRHSGGGGGGPFRPSPIINAPQRHSITGPGALGPSTRCLSLTPPNNYGINTTGSWTHGSPNSSSTLQSLFMSKRPSLQDSIFEGRVSGGGQSSGVVGQQRNRSISGGINISHPTNPIPSQPIPIPHNIMDQHHHNDITSRLESLCLSMTEHALGGSSGSGGGLLGLEDEAKDNR